MEGPNKTKKTNVLPETLKTLVLLVLLGPYMVLSS